MIFIGALGVAFIFLIAAVVDACTGEEVTRHVVVVDRLYEAPYDSHWTEMRNCGTTKNPMYIPISRTTHHPARYLIIVKDEEVERTVDCKQYFNRAREGDRMEYHERVGRIFHFTIGGRLTPTGWETK